VSTSGAPSADAASGTALDPASLFPRVVQQLLQEVLGGGSSIDPPGDGTAPPEDQVARAITTWLTQMFRNAPEEEPSLSVLDWDELLDRNSALAAAVGACDCWGEDPHCAFCDGEGVPGWAPPDEEFFGTYVSPALAAMSTSTTTTTTASNGEEEHDAD
jgi:hypothetical protein